MLDCGTDGVCIEKVGSSPAFCQYGAADSCAGETFILASIVTIA